jgi:predicted metallopeptidase
MKSNNVSFPELQGYVNRLKEAFPNEMKHINSDKILYSNFSKKSSKAAAKVGPIPARFASFFPQYDYFIEVHKEAWEVATESKRLYIILHELTHIPEEGFVNSSGEYRKLIDHDIQDFRHLVNVYGVELEKVEQLAQKVK